MTRSIAFRREQEAPIALFCSSSGAYNTLLVEESSPIFFLAWPMAPKCLVKLKHCIAIYKVISVSA